MMYVACRCGTAVGLPDDFIGELSECPDCRRPFRVVAGQGGAIPNDLLDGRLTIRSGPLRIGEQFILRGDAPVEIGKLPEKAISLIGNLVSRNHCRLERSGEVWCIQDLKSRNGLFINGSQAVSAPLKGGDVIRIGDYELEYSLDTQTAQEVEPGEPIALDEVDDIYELAEEPAAAREFVPVAPAPAVKAVQALGVDPCPSCGKYLPADAVICVNCGINIRTGRALIIRSDVEGEETQEKILRILRIVSFVDMLGLCPVASEGFGKHKPYAVWAIAALTTLVTVFVWISDLSSPSGEETTKSLLLWSAGKPSTSQIMRAYGMDGLGRTPAGRTWRARTDELSTHMSYRQAIETAYEELPTEDRVFGTFHWYQLLTNGLLHASIMHLAGNMLFLLVLGSRVNALIGQWKTAILYPILIVLASLAQLISMSGHGAQAALGASGAIMGLAGMYFVLFPVHRIFLIIWFRFSLWIFVPIWWTRLFYKIFGVRGFWVVSFYIGCDVVATLLGSRDHVAHWAHLGGFLAGMVLISTLLLARQIDANGGDLFTVLLGKRAWALVGKPSDHHAIATAAA